MGLHQGLRAAMSSSDGTIERPFLVWVRGLRGPAPQKWAELYFGLGNWKRRQVLAWQPLSADEFEMSLDYLARLYPPERCAVRCETEM